MSIIEAILLGLVQGLTEFLPVSSSGHLVLLQKIFGITESTLFFDIMLHAGTLLAVMTVLWHDIWAILKKIIQPLTLMLIIATIPAVIAALAFGDAIEHAFESGKFLGFCFLITSVILIIAEKLSRINTVNVLKNQENMNFIEAVIIGIMQAIAIIPGISRSGATISGALFQKLERDFAARFSFLLSIPVILGALILQVKNLFKSVAAETASVNIEVVAVITGTATAAIVGFFAVKLMLKIVREKSLYGFAIYTAILGIFILIDQFTVHLIF
ncbi:MAG: undecaprenyl-diphosphate phosphatase [Treponema sp.]|jgi:undecaprenyl-diphosphatase|nr:undecaprenyl-diphosphate phosphatase [Treponema sp.]